MNCRLAFLLSFLLAGSLYAADASAIGHATILANLTYSIEVPTGASQVTFTTYAFPNTTAQSGQFYPISNCTSSKDAFGNSVIAFSYVPDGTDTRVISVSSQFDVSYDPSQYSFEAVMPNGPDYISASNLSKIDGSIISLSQSIAGNLATPMEKAAALASWVNNRIVYDDAFKDFAADSITTLNAMRGTCDEKSHLLIALLRAQKIPARHVVGFAYSGKSWGPHAWTEAAIGGKWIPMDSTFNEFMFLDAGHIKLAVGRDQDDTRSELDAKGLSSLEGAQVTPRYNFTFLSTSNYSDFFGIESSFPKESHTSGETVIVNATLRNLLPMQIAVPLSIGLHEDFSLGSDQDKILLLGPQESKDERWQVVFPLAMRSGFFYNYSASINAYGKSSEGFLFAQSGEPANPSARIDLEDFFASSDGGNITLKLSVRNSGNEEIKGAHAGIRAFSYSSDLVLDPIPIGGRESLSFVIPVSAIPANSSGKYLTGDITINYSGNSAVQQFSVSLAEPSAAPTRDPNNIEITPEFLLSPQFLVALLCVIVLTFLITKLVREAA